MNLLSTLRLLAIPVALLFATAAEAQIGTSTTQPAAGISIWPVPFTHTLTVKVPGLVSPNVEMQLLNDHQIPFAQYAGAFDNQYTMQVGHVPPGSYTIIVIDRGKVIARKRVTKL